LRHFCTAAIGRVSSLINIVVIILNDISRNFIKYLRNFISRNFVKPRKFLTLYFFVCRCAQCMPAKSSPLEANMSNLFDSTDFVAANCSGLEYTVAVAAVRKEPVIPFKKQILIKSLNI
jgi:hypothetical protein